ncbi:hypothetical protein CS0771_02230 [Catellatospora sp. IY07-71]|uniref:protein NO VEIN domain-containing protein n=1 Tax=Catellatospora sp. IY07-71 TaxID=2728827 RepID=UPI001BB3413C|nr:DUF3883 domain-containing protein [Catellatospora sp. IY07-71]BCJ70679.1 hypothetical protein CS0771_02230 [Catellatospora sp. IY07-71]
MVPSRGFAQAAVLLAWAAALAPRRDIPSWINAAKRHGAFLAAATDLPAVADALVRWRLAIVDDRIDLAGPLAALAQAADRATLTAMARLALTCEPPAWLPLVVSGPTVSRAYIPSQDLRILSWLEPNLDQIIIDVAADLAAASSVDVKSALGTAGELVILHGLRCQGMAPVHVAEVSDAYGYDIEVRLPRVKRIEVKAASRATRHQFHLSRNEYDKSRLYHSEWMLLQVVFTNEAFTAETLTHHHIEDVFELTADTLAGLVPRDNTAFRWSESAIISPPAESWREYELRLPPGFRLPGLKVRSSLQIPGMRMATHDRTRR